MTNSPSIVPSETELRQWESLILDEEENVDVVLMQAFQAGADQELEACCEEMKSLPSPLGIPFGEMASNALRATRRPKSLGLKEQALKELAWVDKNLKVDFFGHCDAIHTIRRALEQLDG